MDNYMIRRYDLDSFNIVDTARLISMEYGVESTTGGPYQVRSRVYTLDGSLDFANFTLVVSDTTDVYPDSSNYTIEEFFPPGYYLLPGDTAVAEIYLPSSTVVGFFLGSNPLLETDTSFLAAPGCGFFVPTTVDDIGFPGCHYLIHIWVNQTPSIGLVTDTTLKNFGTYVEEERFNMVLTDPDSTDMTGGMVRLVTTPPNGNLFVEGVFQGVGDTILAENLDSLWYLPNPGFFGDDVFRIDIRDGYHWSYDTTDVEIHVINWVTGIEEVDEILWEIYPNPVRDELRFKGLSEVIEVKIFDSKGALVYETRENSNIVSLAHLSSGMHILEVTDTGGIHTKQFVKE